MRKIIEFTQENAIQCDNPQCDYVVKNNNPFTANSSLDYLNKSCPKCGENLLTEEDHNTYVKTLKIVNWINKYFSWLTIFIPTKKQKPTTMTLHCHKGVHFSENKEKE